MRSTSDFKYCCAFLAVLTLGVTAVGLAQAAKPMQSYPACLPYSFSNFVWWNNDELRALLKQRIPNIGEEIAPTGTAESSVRDALKTLLRAKGIVAVVQSVEPSRFSLGAERTPGAPDPSIVFSIQSPKILVDKVVISLAPESLMVPLSETLQVNAGREYSAGHDWMVRSRAKEVLESNGYLDAQVDIAHDAPRHDGDHYLVNLLVSVKPGLQYRISSITADGGPLLPGRDLSRFFAKNPGDTAVANPFGRLAGELRAFYWHHGYADVEIHGPPIFDRTRALVSYHLEVSPGPVYHLRNLTIHNLNAQQEMEARKLLAMKPGDVFDEIAVISLYHKLAVDPSLAAYGFTFNPAEDKATATVDLTLDFYKIGGKSRVLIK